LIEIGDVIITTAPAAKYTVVSIIDDLAYILVRDKMGGEFPFYKPGLDIMLRDHGWEHVRMKKRNDFKKQLDEI
jgi:hypothetical protein